MKLTKPERSIFENHFANHTDSASKEKLIEISMSGPVCAMVREGDDIIETTKKMIGDEDPQNAAIGTFRGDFGLSKGRNAVDGSRSVTSAEREIDIWFTEEEIYTFKDSAEEWLYENVLEEPEKPANSEQLLNDSTRIGNQTWASLKDEAMQADQEKSTWFVSKLSNYQTHFSTLD